MINVFIYDSRKNKEYDEKLFPESLRFYLKNNKKEEISYIAYSMLIDILKEYYKLEKIDFDFTNKPILTTDEVNFNISHSGNFIAIGVSCQNEVGIDIESLERDISDNLYNRALHPQEIISKPETCDKKTHFLMCHTRKEAFLKLRGTGFNVRPNSLNTYYLDHLPIYNLEKEKLILCVAGASDGRVSINKSLELF